MSRSVVSIAAFSSMAFFCSPRKYSSHSASSESDNFTFFLRNPATNSAYKMIYVWNPQYLLFYVEKKQVILKNNDTAF